MEITHCFINAVLVLILFELFVDDNSYGFEVLRSRLNLIEYFILVFKLFDELAGVG